MAAAFIAVAAVRSGLSKKPSGDALAATAAAGIFSGCLWNCGNILSAYATGKPCKGHMASILMLHMLHMRECSWPVLKYHDVCMTGMALVPADEIGYALAYPLFQCALLVSGIWGITRFGEFDEEPALSRNLFYGSGGVLLSGAALLALGLS